VRIVAMTAHAMKGDRERCLAAGMDGYLSKPIDRLELFAVVEQNAAAAAAIARPAIDVVFDASTMLERLGGDKTLMHDVVEVFLEDTPRLLAAIHQAIEASDAEGLQSTAHELKGAAGNLAAAGVVDAARALEILGRHAAFDAAPAAWLRLETEASRLAAALRENRAAALAEMTCAS